MSSQVNRLTNRVLGIEVLTSAIVSLIVLAIRWLLVLEAKAADASTILLGTAIAIAGVVAPVRSLIALHRYRFLLRALALGSSAVDTEDLGKLTREAYRSTLTWLLSNAALIVAFTLFARPDFLDPATTFGVAFLALLVVSAAALPLYAALRAVFLGVMELAPLASMAELVAGAEKSRQANQIIRYRLIIAVVAPVGFVTLGSTLVVSSHIRHADEQQREASALAIGRSTFDESPGVVKTAGLAEAIDVARQFGLNISWSPERNAYLRRHTPGGALELVAPLDSGSVTVRLASVHFAGIGWIAWCVTAAAVLAAAWLGTLLGRFLVQDLGTATREVRSLDTRLIVAEGQHVVQAPSLAVVAELSASVEQLAGRFRVFAQAQERAIEVGEATTRMRGLFFASVSHDLKSPLNSILGFTEMVRHSEFLTSEQEESLRVIDRSGRELLALIETILDAARVEARQLQLVRETVTVDELVSDIVEKGRHLAGDNSVDVIGDISAGVGLVDVDRVRFSNALATFVGHAGRSVPGAIVRLHIAPLDGNVIGFALEIPASPTARKNELEGSAGDYKSMPSPHRGLALGMGLARSIIELHGGTIHRVDRGTKGLRFVVRLPAHRPSIDLPKAPLYTSPLPPKATEKGA
jgi:signal transduction histidine kinase